MPPRLLCRMSRLISGYEDNVRCTQVDRAVRRGLAETIREEQVRKRRPFGDPDCLQSLIRLRTAGMPLHLPDSELVRPSCGHS